jgi:hypothetical protein
MLSHALLRLSPMLFLRLLRWVAFLTPAVLFLL